MLKQVVKPVLCSLVVGLTLLAASSAVAQLSPPISPWMGMFDRDRSPGTISNYHHNVKPQQDMRRAYAAQASQIQSQQRALQAMLGSGGGSSSNSSSDGTTSRDLTGAIGGASSGGSGVTELLSPPREIPSMQRNPAGFNQYLHYYPPGSMQRRPVPNFSATGGRR